MPPRHDLPRAPWYRRWKMGLVWTRVAACAGCLLALPTAAEALTLDAARSEAERRAPPVVVATQQAAVARTEVQVAGTLPNPTVTLLTAKRSALLSAGLSLPLPLLGQRGKMVAAAQADSRAIAMEGEVARLSARWGATRAWLDLWGDQERARLLALSQEETQRLHDIARTRFEAGQTPKLDLVRTAADLARASAEVTAARSLTAAAAARLIAWVGEDDSLPAADGAPHPPESLPELSTLATQTAGHPLIRRDQAQVEAAVAHVTAEQRNRLPIPVGEISINYRDRTDDNQTDLVGGLAFDLPVLNLRGGAIARARAQQLLVETERGLDERQLRIDLRDAYFTAQASAERARALRDKVLPAAEEARRMTEESYREGRIDLLRLIEAQRAVLETRLAELEARLTWCQATADIEKTTGAKLLAP